MEISGYATTMSTLDGRPLRRADAPMVGCDSCQCRRHHRMIHAGYRMGGDPNGELRYYRPDGTYIGSTYPAHTRQLAGV
jgi:hypothetical protein